MGAMGGMGGGMGGGGMGGMGGGMGGGGMGGGGMGGGAAGLPLWDADAASRRKRTPKPGEAERNRRIEDRLEKHVSMRFAKETPIGDVLTYLLEQTADSKGKTIPIYLDPIGLQQADKTRKSPVTIEMEDVPARITLRLVLDQLDLVYRVEEGLIFVEAKHDEDANFLGVPEPRPADLERNKAVEAALDKDVPMPFGRGSTLKDVVRHIRDKTADAGGKKIAIYIDPVALREADRTDTAPVALDLEDVPLRTTLRLLLGQISLIYKVEDGMLKITGPEEFHDEIKPKGNTGGGFQ